MSWNRKTAKIVQSEIEWTETEYSGFIPLQYCDNSKLKTSLKRRETNEKTEKQSEVLVVSMWTRRAENAHKNHRHFGRVMIATFFLIFAFLRSLRWSRRRAPPLNDEQEKSLIESKDKLSSLGHSIFSRSDSSATTTSSSGGGGGGGAGASGYTASSAPGTFIGGNKRRGDSTASTISTSVFSETVQTDGRRSSDGVRAVGQANAQQRRSSGRIRRFAGSRTTIAGARRRTTGRFEFFATFLCSSLSLSPSPLHGLCVDPTSESRNEKMHFLS